MFERLARYTGLGRREFTVLLYEFSYPRALDRISHTFALAVSEAETNTEFKKLFDDLLNRLR